MIKQISISNLYNFRDELSIDFVSHDEKETLYHRFNQDDISNFSLLYGKNNIGKTNFFKIIKESLDFILYEKLSLKETLPIMTPNPSLFEIVLENKDFEIRYGFEVDLSRHIMIDEWLYAQATDASEEVCLFNRAEKYFAKKISPFDAKALENLMPNYSYLSYFKKVSHQLEEINTFFYMLENIHIVDCAIYHDEKDLINSLLSFSDNRRALKLLNAFLESADLDIKEVILQKLNKEELELLQKLKSIEGSDLSRQKKKEKSESFLQENIHLLPQLLNKDVLKHAEDYEALSFLHKSGAHFSFAEISSGSKQLINIILPMIEGIEHDAVMIFDEIELGLHFDLVNLVIQFFKDIVQLIPTTQFIISTHRAELLDYNFISNQNKVIFKLLDPQEGPSIEYLSQYKMNEDHEISKRYLLDAYGSNPDTSSQYHLLSRLQEILED